MSLKPVSIRQTLQTRETLWETIRNLKTFTVTDLAMESNLDHTTIGTYLRSLVKAGILGRTKREGSRPAGTYMPLYTYQLLRDSHEPPRVREDGTQVTQGQGRANMWRSMKTLKRFTLADLRMCSSTSRQAIARDEAATYLRFLVAAGYVKKADNKPIDRATYALVRWTGPKAPMIQRIKQVWDPNLRAVTWPPQVQEEAL